MLTEREMRYRAKCAADQGIPFTNYGITLAHLNGILNRCMEPLMHSFRGACAPRTGQN